MSPSDKNRDEHYMRMALSLAMRGIGTTSPNPRVGCVIVRNGEVIGQGWHERRGEPHAEVNAVRDADGNIAGADVYVNLEPCCHYGTTPPCADMLIKHRPARVVMGMTDPNPAVNCGGKAKLEAAGIATEVGVLEDECRHINRGFIKKIESGLPWTTLKIGASMDGKIALSDGSSKWITGPEARKRVHMMRAENDALITGVGTILADDPELTVREAEGKNPLRAVLDRHLRTPSNAKILNTEPEKVIFYTSDDAPNDKRETLKKSGASVVNIETDARGELEFVLSDLCARGVNYLMCEAGAAVVSSFLSSGLTDSVALFLAPKLMGCGKSFTDGVKIESMDDCIKLKDLKYTRCGDDILVEGVIACSQD